MHHYRRDFFVCVIVLGLRYMVVGNMSSLISCLLLPMLAQNCAWRRWRVKKGDVVGAFLQNATPLDKPQFCVPVPELATALGLKPGGPAEVAKAIYGLLRGPNLWVFGAVFTHLRENGWQVL